MNLDEIASQSDALLRLGNWTHKEGKYVHASGPALIFSPLEPRKGPGILSPSSLPSVDKCARKLYLNRNPGHPEYKHVSVAGESVVDSPVESVWTLEGSLIHDSLSLIVNDLLPNWKELRSLEWGTVILPAIHTSASKIVANMRPNEKTIKPLLGAIEIRFDRISRVITNVAEGIWARRLGGFAFDRKSWGDLSQLAMKGECYLEKDGFHGFADLVFSSEAGDAVIVDYKTSRNLDLAGEDFFDDSRTADIVSDPSDELHSHVTQICCYAWMVASEEKAVHRVLLAYVGENPVSVMEFQIGERAMNSISSIVSRSLGRLKEIINYSQPPSGLYDPYVCGWCQFKMNCGAFDEGSRKVDVSLWLTSGRRRPLPILLNVNRIVPDDSMVKMDKGGSLLAVHILGNRGQYLRMVKSILEQGHDLKAYVELRGLRDDLFAKDIEFSRCA